MKTKEVWLGTNSNGKASGQSKGTSHEKEKREGKWSAYKPAHGFDFCLTRVPSGRRRAGWVPQGSDVMETNELDMPRACQAVLLVSEPARWAGLRCVDGIRIHPRAGRLLVDGEQREASLASAMPRAYE